MDDRLADSWRCPHCGARGRASDAWCSLCHAERPSGSAALSRPERRTPRDVPGPAPAKRPTAPPAGSPSVPAAAPPVEPVPVPFQRRGPADPRRPLVGGSVPDDLLADLAGSLAEAERRPPRWERPGVAAAAWTGIGTVVLLVAMLAAGLLL